MTNVDNSQGTDEVGEDNGAVTVVIDDSEGQANIAADNVPNEADNNV